MSTQAPPASAVAADTPDTDPARPRAGRAVLVVFTASIFTSAFLLFLVQPMFSRMVLPLLGGTPAVWNTCMLFFQAALLAGYGWAHVGGQKLGARRQAAVHVVLLLVAAALLPISVAGAAPQGGAAPIPWLLLLMVTTVGLPFFVLSATGPMLQKWFADTGHPGAANPYWLYAASNLGSMLALLGYPFLMEPRLRLAEQSLTWAVGYGVLAVLVIASAWMVWRLAPAGPAAIAGDAAEAEVAPVSSREKAIWVALAFIPSSLLLSVTSFITTDVAPVPLLWVVPLALYLLTFTVAFATRPPIKHEWAVTIQPISIATVSLLLMYGWTRKPELVIPIHLVAFFITALVCHGELARRRPPVRYLTEFYLWIAVGGVVGGIFNVLVAPVIFTRVWEYPLVIALACLARPWPAERMTRRQVAINLLRTVGLVLALLLVTRTGIPGIPDWMTLPLSAMAIAVVAGALGRAPGFLALCIGASLLIRTIFMLQKEETMLAHRSFYGRYTVQDVQRQGGYHALYHGSTLHGAQSTKPRHWREPLTYYHRNSPVGQLFAATAEQTGRRRVAVVGLGSGTLAAYSQAGEQWTFYEIDPGIVKIARTPRYFTYLRDSPAQVSVVLGDARLSMTHAPKHAYDLIVVDAFNSDAIPVHLLTREAMGVYLDKLAPGGILMLHLSNRYLDLEPVVAALARERGLKARVGENRLSGFFFSASVWAIVARSSEDFGPLAADARWHDAKPRRDVRPWTDDYSSLLSVWD